MIGFGTILAAVLPVFAIMAAGLVIRRVNWLTEEADQSMFRVVVNLLMPCLILDTAANNPAFNNTQNLLLAPLIGFATVALNVGIVWFTCARLNFSGPPARRTFALATGLQNYGYIPLPLIVLLFDQSAAGVLFLYNVGVEACLWSVLLLMLTGGHAGGGWKQIFNAPLFSIVLALVLNFTGAMAHLPAALVTTLHWLGQCAFPIALILVGATIADDIKGSAFEAGSISIIAIFIYILFRFRKWQYSTGAIIALLHDTLFTFSAFAIADLFGFSFEIDQVFVAALLTIIGYSINDTVIIFDRIREYLKLGNMKDQVTVFNHAINNTLSRTLITSGKIGRAHV